MTGCLHELLAHSADRASDDTAVVDRERELTYGELDRRANRVAHRLLRLGVRRGDRVGLVLAKSAESVIAAYGVIAAGAAYVPLSADAPLPRLAYIVRDAGIRVVLTDDEAAGHRLADAAPTVTDVVVLRPDDVPREDDVRARVPTGPDDLAYVLYTSGSTGRPKGVLLTHRNALSFVDWAVGEFGVRREDRLSNHAPLHFDLAVFDLFAAARTGAAVVLVPPELAAFPVELAAFVRERRITVWYSVPFALNLLALRGGLARDGLPDLRLVMFAGEVYPVAQLRRMMDLVPQAEFVNLYGPTETNVCTSYRVPRPLPADCGALPIGTAITGVEVFARSDDGGTPAAGQSGELWVRGPTVMQGYLGDAEQTARVLRPPSPGERPAYRTGDLGRQDALGRWQFLGRRDNQIKSRGYRIELGEVERVVGTHPAVADCAVVAVPDAVLGNRIKAFVVLRDEPGSVDLIAHCRAELPGYMVPWAVDVTDALPRTATGKVNYQMLKAADQEKQDVVRR